MKEFVWIAAVVAIGIFLAVWFVKKRKAAKEAAFFEAEDTALPEEKTDEQSAEDIMGKTGYLVGLDPWSRK